MGRVALPLLVLLLTNEGLMCLLTACPDYVFYRLLLLLFLLPFLTVSAKGASVTIFCGARLGRLAEKCGQFVLISHVSLVLLLTFFLALFCQPLRPRKPRFVLCLIRWRPTTRKIIVHKSLWLIVFFMII